MIIIGTIPVVVLGLALKDLIERDLGSLYVIAFARLFLAIARSLGMGDVLA